MRQQLINALKNHENLRGNAINLLPSENILSPLARRFLSSDMGQRYFFDDPFVTKGGFSYSYNGTDYIKQVLNVGQQIANELFHSKYASLYPLSGHQTNTALLFAYCKPNDSIIVYDPKYGGYPGLDKDKLPKYLGLNVHYFPVHDSLPEVIDEKKTIDLIRRVRPKLLIYNLAHTLFPFNFSRILNVANEYNALFVYDGSHPLGLIAGGEFQNPLKEGADFLIGGTQKSFPGPQGGIMLTIKHEEKLKSVEHFVIVDNPHFHRISALTVALAEAQTFGKEYAQQVIKNTKHLAEYLYNLGLPILYEKMGFTKSHMFKIKVFEGYFEFTKNLEKANIIVDSAGRIGTAEMTRIGMKEQEMEQIGDLINCSYHGEDFQIIKKKAVALVSQFGGVQFGYNT